MKRVLVTGGAGYLGSILVPYLLRQRYHVTVIDNFRYGQTSLLDCCFDRNLSIHRQDVRDERAIVPEVKKADIILPLACITGAPACAQDPVSAESVNLEAVRLILKIRSKSQIVIFPTTNSGYGIGENVLCTEETPLRPVSLYGKLKIEAERAVLDAGNSITLRLATVFGISPRMRLDLLVNDFTYRAVTDRFLVLFEAHFKRNYVHVRDVAVAFHHCIKHFSDMRDNSYNFGLSEANLSKLELCEEIRKLVPDFYFVEASIGEDPDKRDYIVSNAKIEQTALKAKVSLPDGIQELVKGFQIIRKSNYTNL